MAEDDEGCAQCKCCMKFIFVAGGWLALILWLAITHKPKCSIQYFYVPALNKSLNSQPLNTTLNFMVRLDNPNRNQGIYYDDVHVSLYNTFNTSNSSLLLANYTVPRFYQGHKKKAKKWGQTLPLNNQTVLRAILPNGSTVFRLNLKTQVRFKNFIWKTKRFGIEVGANVEVDDEGRARFDHILLKHLKGSSSIGVSEILDPSLVEGGDGGKNTKKEIKKSSSSAIRWYFPVCVLMNLLVFFAIL